ncbi:uncharacterized protein LY89DRAFT_669463 [Mollisia scopiformis]|uniref:Homeobox domain-containing protein n=1 Tax=Mollisia scopiformis TaxID=149040 RepID=A0A194XA33_MOLSC|nr:uncharacterized protein LY89DRAFT_669463 [Mollisia scopiformis]KUJ17033.1 hypothetical protein LY89DRAFT_669463 [Mollisia scopiformis]
MYGTMTAGAAGSGGNGLPPNGQQPAGTRAPRLLTRFTKEELKRLRVIFATTPNPTEAEIKSMNTTDFGGKYEVNKFKMWFWHERNKAVQAAIPKSQVARPMNSVVPESQVAHSMSPPPRGHPRPSTFARQGFAYKGPYDADFVEAPSAAGFNDAQLDILHDELLKYPKKHLKVPSDRDENLAEMTGLSKMEVSNFFYYHLDNLENMARSSARASGPAPPVFSCPAPLPPNDQVNERAKKLLDDDSE